MVGFLEDRGDVGLFMQIINRETMNAVEIKELLGRYFEGETTEAEESLLGRYFQYGEVGEEFKKYVPLFAFYREEREIGLDIGATERLAVPLGSGGTMRVVGVPKRFALSSVLLRAAVVIVAVMGGALLFLNNPMKPGAPKMMAVASKHKARVITFDENDPEKAYAEVRSALLMVSGKMKKGTDPVGEGMGKVSEATRVLGK